MASSISFTSVCSFKPSNKPDMIIGHSVARKVLRTNEVFGHSKSPKFQSLEVKASESNGGTKPNSIVCADCDGNVTMFLWLCDGTGVNSVDHFNGQFKVGGLCWLCRGKRDILCGNCNGAGFMSTFDE